MAIGGTGSTTIIKSPATSPEWQTQHSFLPGQTGRVAVAISEWGRWISTELYPRGLEQEARRHLNQSRSVVLEVFWADSD